VNEWWRTAVVYQVWPRSFQDSDGDGVGDLPGVLQRLDHLSDLGVDVVWLSPVFPSPQVDNGYDVSNYQDVDPLFGSLADLDALIQALHARGMRLVLDVVLNHTSDQHPWFIESRGSRESPKRDWYWWRAPGEVPGAEPNAWQSLFSGSAWQLDDATGEYYLHTFARQQPDLNWESPQVRAAMAEMLRWWVDRGVDGFRLDVISMISKAPANLLGFGPRLHDYLRELHEAVFAEKGLLTIGETPGISVAQAQRMTDPARRELDLVLEFEHVSLDQGATKWEARQLGLPRLKQCFARWQEGLAGTGWNSLYWNNHDQPRAVSRFGDDGEHRVASATTLATVLHLHRGTPFVFQGEELGMRNAGFTALVDYRDVESINHYEAAVSAGHAPHEVLAALQRMSRDNARTPVQWDGSVHAGFSTAQPWIAVNQDHVEVNAAAQRGDPQSVLAHYRRLIALRHDVPAVALGEFALLLPDHEQVWAFTRTHLDVQLLVVANLSDREVEADVPDTGWADAELLLGNLPGGRGGLRLRPWESRVLRRTR
jgi:oligo-1,6-glucosidase